MKKSRHINLVLGRGFIFSIILVLFILGLTNCFQAKKPDPTSQSPNVIVMYIDDLNNFQTGCYGGNVNTPNIDKLASEGIRFTRYYPCSSICSPSRFSALTGRYPSRSLSLLKEFSTDENVLISWNTDIIEGETTIAHILKDEGYTTGFTGKWHNWADALYSLLSVPDLSDPNDKQAQAAIQKNYETTREYIKKTSGFDFVEAVYASNFEWLPITKKLKYHNQHWITYNSIKFIEQNKNKPFFLYMATTLPHYPRAIESLRSDPRATPAGYLTEHLDCQPSYQNMLERAKKAGMKTEDEINSWATMAWIDDGIGAILTKLDELGIRDNTIIILASDNENIGKMTCYQGRAPLIVNWKEHIKESKVCDELVSNIDIVPTILDVCFIDKPGKYKIDGLSLTPLFQESNSNWRNSMYMEVTFTRAVVTKNNKYIAVRFPKEIENQVTNLNRSEFTQEGVHMKPGEKVRFGSDKLFPGYYDKDQLYDLKKDSMEQQNLADNPEYKKTLQEMQQILKYYSADLPFSFGEFKK